MLVLIDLAGVLAALFLAVLLANHLRFAWEARRPTGWCQAAALPFPSGRPAPDVLVQIPVYNEGMVLAAALQAALALDWPADRLTIQLLDDSTDGSADRAAALIAGLAVGGPRVEHLRRAMRDGYKAGALAEGLVRSRAAYVAMLDADFRAPRDWLCRAIGALEAAPRAAFVQFRFEFSNRDQNWMTRGQQLSVDAHFLAEQAGRAACREPFQFNGTGGVWRRSAIDAVGGWSADTLAEDLDLAMRIFAAGYEARLVLDPPLSCEAPADVAAWRVQQERWSAGFVQVALKAAPLVWTAAWPRLTRASTLLLLGLQFALPCFLLAVAAFLLDGFLRGFDLRHLLIAAGAAIVATTALLAITAPPFFRLRRGGKQRYLTTLVALPALLIYMALANSAAVLAAPFRRHRVFIRTPKSGQG